MNTAASPKAEDTDSPPFAPSWYAPAGPDAAIHPWPPSATGEDGPVSPRLAVWVALSFLVGGVFGTGSSAGRTVMVTVASLPCELWSKAR